MRRWYERDEKSIRDIADRLDATQREVRAVLQFIGVEMRTEGAGADAVDWPPVDTLCKWHHDDEKSLRAIANRLDCNPESVKQKFGREGIDVRGTFRKLGDEVVPEIRKRAAESGCTYGEIASDYDVSAATIGQIVRGESYPDAPGPIKGEDYE